MIQPISRGRCTAVASSILPGNLGPPGAGAPLPTSQFNLSAPVPGFQMGPLAPTLSPPPPLPVGFWVAWSSGGCRGCDPLRKKKSEILAKRKLQIERSHQSAAGEGLLNEVGYGVADDDLPALACAARREVSRGWFW
jgi:hypothetical protein